MTQLTSLPVKIVILQINTHDIYQIGISASKHFRKLLSTMLILPATANHYASGHRFPNYQVLYKKYIVLKMTQVIELSNLVSLV